MATLCELFNKLEDGRNAALMDAAIEREINDLDFDIFLLEEARNSLNAENIEDIRKLEGKFVISFKSECDLYRLVGLEMPDGISAYENDWGFRIAIDINDPEMLDEYFSSIVKTVEEVIADRKRQIETLEGR